MVHITKKSLRLACHCSSARGSGRSSSLYVYCQRSQLRHDGGLAAKGKSGRMKKGAPKVWHKCKKCKDRFGVKPETKTTQGAQHREGNCGGRCEGGKGCDGCS